MCLTNKRNSAHSKKTETHMSIKCDITVNPNLGRRLNTSFYQYLTNPTNLNVNKIINSNIY